MRTQFQGRKRTSESAFRQLLALPLRSRACTVPVPLCSHAASGFCRCPKACILGLLFHVTVKYECYQDPLSVCVMSAMFLVVAGLTHTHRTAHTHTHTHTRSPE